MKKALEWFRRLEYILLVLPMAFLCICIVVNIFMRAFLAVSYTHLTLPTKA